MSAFRTIKFEWKAILGIAWFTIGAVFAIYQLYLAWSFAIIRNPWVLFGPRFVTLAGEPVWFWISVTLFAVIALVLPLALWVIVFDLRNAVRSFRVRETRPPLDDAIRQGPDER